MNKDEDVKKESVGFSGKKAVLSVAGLLMSMVFLPTTVLLVIGLLPTFAAFFLRNPMKILCVGAINLAGASPFLLELWKSGHTIDISLQLIMDPKNIVVVYCAAAAGYIIDWVVTTIVSTYKVQTGKARVASIKKEQKKLVERWGKEVTGDYEMDERGFALEGELVD